eukprot:SAG31_NODE_24174_length_487_cov_1.128866_1_plen_28_part_10
MQYLTKAGFEEATEKLEEWVVDTKEQVV